MKETAIDTTLHLLEQIAGTTTTIYQAIVCLEDAIVTARIQLAKHDTVWNRQHLAMLQAVLTLVQKPEEETRQEDESNAEPAARETSDDASEDEVRRREEAAEERRRARSSDYPPVECPWTERMSWGL